MVASKLRSGAMMLLQLCSGRPENGSTRNKSEEEKNVSSILKLSAMYCGNRSQVGKQPTDLDNADLAHFQERSKGNGERQDGDWSEWFHRIWEESQVIAFICGVIVVILMIMALASTDWLMAAGWRQGLFMHCIAEGAPMPLPFNMQDPPDCYQARDVAYIKAAAALCIITLLTDLVATVLTAMGLRSKDHRTKYKYYRFAVYVMVISLISILIALVIYPVCFAAELNEGNRTVWEFGWAYGVGWGAAIFLFGGVILLLCDKESEEIYYKERKIVHDSDSRA